jgi:predicted transcriptional regulator
MNNEFKTLSSIDAVLATTLIVDFNYLQADVADLFDVTAASISQYKNKVRGCNVALSDDVTAEINSLAYSLAVNGLSKHELRKRRFDILLLNYKYLDEHSN